MKSTLWLMPFAALLLVACASGDYSLPGGTISGTATPPPPAPTFPTANWTVTDNAILTTGLEQQSPTTTDSFNGVIPLSHLQVGAITRGYEFTTPSNTSLAFSVIAIEEGNTGPVTIRVGHSTPAGSAGAESIFTEGMALEGPGLVYTGNWVYASGDGAATLTVRGAIGRTQVLVFEVTTSAGVERIAVRLRIGAQSDVNIYAGVYPSAQTISRETIFSSDEPGFGLPAIAVSGDRYSVTAYAQDAGGTRVRRWLQYDAQANAVTGGEGQNVSPDQGSWRDQEIAALNNVLAVAYTGNSAVQVEISLDRGASFGTGVVLNESSSTPVQGQRLVQIEIAQDYTLAVAYWRTNLAAGITSELCLAEATPTGFDSNNTPTGYAFAAPWIVHTVAGSVVPVVMDLEYSVAGDLVIGYGYNQFTSFTAEVVFRCAIRYATGTLDDQFIDSEWTSWGCDPSVAVLGSGSSIQVFYAYEKASGINLRELRNGGAMPGNSLAQGAPGAYLPSVHARVQGGVTRVDLLFIAPENMGWSLKRVHWDDFVGNFLTNTHSTVFQSTSQPGGTPLNASTPGVLVKSVGWMGYDAVTDGDDVAISLHTYTVDLYENVTAPGMPPSQNPPGAPTYYGTPTLLPGMTGSVAAPNAADMNQLEIIVLD